MTTTTAQTPPASTGRRAKLNRRDREAVKSHRRGAKRWDACARSAERSRGWDDEAAALLDDWATNARRFARSERDMALRTIAAAST